MDSWRCPACGHRHRTPRYVGNYVACDYCDEMFPASTVNHAPRKTSSSAAKKDEPEEPHLLVRIIFGDPEKAIEGAIPGAIGGLFAGITVGIMQGYIVSQITKRMTIGLAAGFAIGIILGAVWGPYGPMARLGWKFRPVFAALFSGALIGMLIGFLIGSIQWLILVGGAAGATGATLWALLAIKVEAGASRPPSKVIDADLAAYYDQRLNKRRRSRSSLDDELDSGIPGEDAFQT
jgi:hypothetical protein